MSNNNISDQNSYPVRIHGLSGSLKDLLKMFGNFEMYTLEDILRFRKDYAVVRKKKINDSIEQVKLGIRSMMAEMNQLALKKDEVIKSKTEELTQTISRLEVEIIPSRRLKIVGDLYYKIRRWARNRKIKYYKNELQITPRRITQYYGERIARIEDKLKYTENNIEAVAQNNISSELRTLDALNDAIEKEKYLIQGAIGENKVIAELRKLPEAYHVINDFRRDFRRPLYNRAEDDRIFSIQVDHLVVGPTGIFIIETKYWSSSSISNNLLYSPVKQVKRAGFALFVILNDAIKSGHIERLVNNWGERKISPKKIVASVNSIPHGEFQYVKVLQIDKLNSHITYGKQEFTTEEIQDIVGYLLRTSQNAG